MLKFRMRGRVTSVFLFLIFLSWLSEQLEAQIFFGVSPIRVEHKIKAGGQLTDVFYVRNNSSRPIRLKVYVENWYLKEDGTPVFIGSREGSYSCRDWIKVNPFDFRIQPGEIKQVRYTISVPEKVETGGYHAAVSFENVPETTEANRLGQVAFTGKIAAAVYVLVGKTEPAGSIEDVTWEKSGSNQFLKIKVANSGRTHFRLKGEVVIKNSQGKKVATLEVPDEPVLPESWRFVAIPVKETLGAGQYRVEVRIDIGREEILGLDKEFEVK